MAVDVLEDPNRGFLVTRSITQWNFTPCPHDGGRRTGDLVDYAIAVASGRITPQLPIIVSPRLPQGFLIIRPDSSTPRGAA